MNLGPHRYRVGDVIGRWTVTRLASPVQRMHGNDKLIWQHRVSVKCVCGVTDIVRERLIQKGESRGCSSRTCMHAVRTQLELTKWNDLLTHAAEMRRLADEAERAASDAHLRIAAAREKLDRLTSKLNGRTWRR